MLKLIGIAAVVYIGWITGLIQATLMITAGVLIAVAGARFWLTGSPKDSIINTYTQRSSNDYHSNPRADSNDRSRS